MIDNKNDEKRKRMIDNGVTSEDKENRKIMVGSRRWRIEDNRRNMSKKYIYIKEKYFLKNKNNKL